MSDRIKRISAVVIALCLCGCSGGAKAGDSSSQSESEAKPAAAVSKAEEKQALPEIKGFKGSTNKTQFKLSWNEFEGADGYEIAAYDPETLRTELYFTGDCKYAIKDRAQGERRIFSLKAYKSRAGKKEYIAQSAQKQLTVMSDRAVLSVQSVCQYSKPELPTGCECAALATVLKYKGVNVTKNEIAADYLEKVPFKEKKGKLIGADPNVAFPGSPEDENSYGCYSTPIANAANKCIKAEGADIKAKAVVGKELSALYKYINNDTPVIIWATMDLKASKPADTWQTADGKKITWYKNEHCLVLIGYDTEKGIVYCADPSKRQTIPTQYDAKKFEKRYKEQGMHAVVIE